MLRAHTVPGEHTHLLSIQPSGQRHHENVPRMCYHDGDPTVSKSWVMGRIVL